MQITVPVQQRRPHQFKTAPGDGLLQAEMVRQNYSLARVLLAGPGLRDGWEFEVSRELERVYQRPPRGVYVPYEVLTRDLSVGNPAAGGVTVETTIQRSLIPFLRARSVVVGLGATVLEDLVGNCKFVRQTGTTTMQWLPENADLTRGGAFFDSVTLTPKRACGQTYFSLMLLRQSSLQIEDVVRNDLVGAIATALDQAALAGTGPANNQPLGILSTPANAPGSGAYTMTAPSVTFGGPPTWPAVLDFEFNVESLNVQSDSRGYVTSPNVKRAWKATPKIAGYPSFLWESGETVNGSPALASNQLSGSDQVIYSPKWSDLLIGLWPNFDIVSDPFTQMQSGQVVVTVNLLADVQLRYGISFAYSTDSGAQS